MSISFFIKHEIMNSKHRMLFPQKNKLSGTFVYQTAYSISNNKRAAVT